MWSDNILYIKTVFYALGQNINSFIGGLLQAKMAVNSRRY
jgi:hypothetical protein